MAPSGCGSPRIHPIALHMRSESGHSRSGSSLCDLPGCDRWDSFSFLLRIPHGYERHLWCYRTGHLAPRISPMQTSLSPFGSAQRHLWVGCPHWGSTYSWPVPSFFSFFVSESMVSPFLKLYALRKQIITAKGAAYLWSISSFTIIHSIQCSQKSLWMTFKFSEGSALILMLIIDNKDTIKN